MTNVLISSYFEKEHIDRINSVDDRLNILYREDLVPPPRWEADHIGPADWSRTHEQEAEFLEMLSEAEVLYDFPRGHVRNLLSKAPKLKWIQGSMAGAGEVAKKAGLLESEVKITTASGVYSGPLAEFALMAMLQHAKRLDRLREDQTARLWRQGISGTLEGKTLCIVGMGNIGRAVAERAQAFKMRVVGVKRTIREEDEAWNYANELHETANLQTVLGEADYVVLTLPGTPETRHLLDRESLAAIKPGAYLVNIGRGSVIDEAALVESLENGHLSGAALDVFEVEPLPEDSPLWTMENVIVSPHSTDVVPELVNGLQVDLFCENLRRYLGGEPLVNILNKELLY